MSFFLLALILLWWYAGRWYEARLVDEKRTEVSRVMQVNANSLTNAINKRMALISGLKAFILTENDFSNTLTRDAFAKFAAGLYASTKGIRAIQALPGGVVRFVYPVAGNEQTLGHDLLHDSRPAVREDVQRTIRTREITLSNPYQLRQGGLGVVERLAVYRSDDTLWGLAVIVLDIPLLLDAAGITLPGSKIELSLRDKSHKVFYGSGEVFLAGPVIARIELPDGYWELAGIPKEGWGLSIQGSLILFRGVSLSFVLMLSGMVYLTASRQASLAMAVRQKTAELNLELSEVKRADEALRKSEALLEETQRISKVGGWEYEVGSKRLSWTDEVYRIYGVSPDDHDPNDITRDIAYYEDREAIEKAFRRAVESGEPYDLELKFRNAGGQSLWVRTIGSAEQENGKTVRVFGNIMDISERKKTEAALHESEERFRRAVDNIPDVIVIYDRDLKIQFINNATSRVTGRPVSDFIGRREEEIWPPEVYGAYLPVLQEALRTGTIRSLETNLLLPNGVSRALQITCIPLIDENGEAREVLGITHDFTARKQAELELEAHREHLEELVKDRTTALQDSQLALTNIVEDLNQKTTALEAANNKLKELDKLKSLFIASMSHELRTPLNSVIGFSSVLLNQWAGPVNEEQKNLLSTISRSGKHLLSLINDVIDVSKIEAGTIDVHLEEFDLHDVIAEVVELMRKEITEKQLELNVDSIHVKMHTDRRRLFQGVLNLVSNAVKFTLKGSISVHARRVGSSEQKQKRQNSELHGNFVEISVEDTGIGIKEEDMPKLFKSFVRLDSPLRTTVLGTGLGLYLTKKLVTEMLKGDIVVESGYEAGSKFAIRVPVKI